MTSRPEYPQDVILRFPYPDTDTDTDSVVDSEFLLDWLIRLFLV